MKDVFELYSNKIIDSIRRGVISNATYECNNLYDYVKHEAVSQIVRDIVEQNNTEMTAEVLTEKLHKHFKTLNVTLVENFDVISPQVLRDTFNIWVAPKVTSQMKLSEMSVPIGVKLLLNDVYSTQMKLHATLNKSQIKENFNDSMDSLISRMTADEILDKMKEIITIVSDIWIEKSLPIDNIFNNTKNVTFEIILNKAYQTVTVPPFTDDNILVNYIVDDINVSNKKMLQLVMQHKSNYISLIRTIFSHFQSFIKKYNLKEKLNKNGNWRRSTQIQQGFVSIVGEFGELGTKSITTGKKAYENNFVINLVDVIKAIRYQIHTLRDLDNLIDSCEHLGNLSDDEIKDGIKGMTPENKKQVTKYTGLNPIFDELKILIARFELYLLPFLKSNEPHKKSNQIEILDKHEDGFYTRINFIIDYDVVKKINPAIPLEDDIPIYKKWIEEHEGETFIPKED